jgi:hypothetical protein
MDGPRSLIEHFSSVEDPRIDRTKKHQLIDIIMMTIIGSLCGANDWEDIVLICESKEDWLKGFLSLDNGVPSSDTFKRVLSRISPQQFEASFVSWTKLVSEVCSGEIIAIDGKRLRRSYDSSSGRSAIHMVGRQINALFDICHLIPALFQFAATAFNCSIFLCFEAEERRSCLSLRLLGHFWGSFSSFRPAYLRF